MLKIAICDDRREDIRLIRSALENYHNTFNEVDFQTFEYDNPLLFLEELPKNGGFDMVLLDICMPGISGMDIAHTIRKRKDKTEIIFLSTSDEFAIDAFALKAIHYLIKPFSTEGFNEAINRGIANLKSQEMKKIVLRLQNGEVKIIDLHEINYIESFSHTQTIYMKSSEILMAKQSLTNLWESFEEASKGQFIIPYKGYIVNQKNIQTITPDHILLKTGESIPIARRRFRKIRDIYFDYIFQKNQN